MVHYRVYQLSDPNSSLATNLVRAVRETVAQSLQAGNVQIFGLFGGRLGLATNEVYLVTSSENEQGDFTALPGDFEIIQQTDLVPTVRPIEHTPREKPGIYVFRWFRVFNRDVDEIADISNKAWISFEESFDCQVQCLFAEPDRTSEIGTMLLVTWYRDLSVWEESRKAPDEARALFIRRQEMTLKAKPIATQLIKVNAEYPN